MPSRRTLPFAFLCLLACGGEEDVVTGGFDESVIDDQIRHGQGLRVVDVDGDGLDDVVSAVSLTDAVNLYLRTDDPLEPWDRISVSGAGRIVAMDVAVSDLDGDGDQDIAAVGLFQREVGITSPGEVVWYENPGDARGVWLTHRISVPILFEGRFVGGIYGARAIEAADIDGDDDVDLVVGALEAVAARFDLVQGEAGPECALVDPLGNGVFWFPNGGDGRFAGPLPVDPTFAGVSEVEVADLDGDGRLDVLATASIQQAVNWYRNLAGEAGPRFVRYSLDQAAGQYFGLGASDLDGDDALEVQSAVVTPIGATVLTLDQPEDVTTTWPSSTVAVGIGAVACGSEEAAELGPLNDEGCPRLADLCVEIQVCEGPVDDDPPDQCTPAEICDNDEDDDGDGRVDCEDPGCGQNPACAQCVAEQQCANTPAGQVEPVACGEGGDAITEDSHALCPTVVDVCTDGFCAGTAQNPVFTVADFTGDGRPDVVVAEATGELRLYFQQDGGWGRRDIRSGYLGITYLDSADIDGDGRVDFVTSTYELGTRDRISWWRNVGD